MATIKMILVHDRKIHRIWIVYEWEFCIHVDWNI